MYIMEINRIYLQKFVDNINVETNELNNQLLLYKKVLSGIKNTQVKIDRNMQIVKYINELSKKKKIYKIKNTSLCIFINK